MLKRMTAWALVLALLVSVMPQLSLSVTAEGTATPPAEHSHTAAQHDCEHCDEAVTWQAWGDTDEEKTVLPTTAGHFYLVCDIVTGVQNKFTGTVDVTLCLNGYAIDGNAKNTPIYMQDSAKLTIADCTAYTDAEGVFHAGQIRNGKSAGSMASAIFVKNTAQIAVYDCIISGNKHLKNDNTAVGYGGAIQIRADKSTKMASYLENVLFENNSCERDGGALCVYGANAQVTVKNCTFKMNTAANGSAVYVNKGTVSMTECTFTGNTVTEGSGGTIRLASATMVLDNCAITDNTAKNSGGSAIHAGGGNCKLTLKDCTVTGNKSTGTGNDYRGAVYMTNASDKLTVTGKTVIDENYVATGGTPIERGIYFQYDGNAVDVGGLTEGTKISIHTRNVTKATPTMVIAATAPTSWNRQWVVYENNGMAVDYNAADDFYFALNTDHIHCRCGDSACSLTGENHKKVEYLPWNDATTLPNSGTYYLNTNVTMAGAVSISDDLELCLNGHTVKAAEDNRFYSNPKNTEARIVISDCTAYTDAQGVYHAGEMSGGVDVSGNTGGGAFYIRAKGTLMIFDGIITNNTSTLAGGAITMASETKLYLYGGEISNNTAVTADGKTWKNGGAIYVGTGSELHILGGTIKNNTGNDGGAVYFAGSGKLTMTGGQISGNTAKKNGGGIYAYATDVSITGGTIEDNTAVENGGGMGFGSKTKVTIGDVTISGNSCTSYGGGVYAYATELTVTGGKLQENTSNGAGGAVALREGSTLTMTGGEICGNTAKTNGGGIYGADSDLVITGGTVSGSKSGRDGAGAYVRDGNMDISGTASFTDNETESTGGGVCYGSNSTGKIADVTIANNKAANGGGMIIQNGANVEMTNVTVKNNTAESKAGGVYLYNAALKMTGCTVTGNSAISGGGVLIASNANMTIDGGTVSDNTATLLGGGVYADSGTALSLAGAPLIKGNKETNLYLVDGALMQSVTVTEGAAIAVSANVGPISAACEDVSKYFSSDSKHRMVEYRNGVLYMATDGTHWHCLCDAAVKGCDHENLEWVAWESTNSLPASGNYYLLNDVALTAEVSISKDLNLCLNGHTITAAKDKRIISTPKNADADIAITDCTAKTVDGVYQAGKLTGGVDKSNNVGGGAIAIRAGGSLRLFEGMITGNTTVNGGGAVLLAAGSEFTVYGGEISNNAAVLEDGKTFKSGGAIYVTGSTTGTGGAKLSVLGGTIKNNSGITGGAIYAGTDSQLTVSGGTICDNYASGNGGGIYITDSDAVISGGTISGNYSVKDGAGVYIRRGNLNISGKATFTGNETKGSGGAVSFGSNSTGTVSGGTFTDNKGGGGAGLIIQNGADVEITKATIKNNTASNGGGIYLYNAQLKLSGGTISGNKATVKYGGGIYINGKGKLTMTGGTISKNTAKVNGGGITAYTADADISGGTVSGNTSVKDGAGIYVRQGNVNVSGQTVITGNSTTSGSGGGISYGTDSTGTVSGGTISKNKGSGGGGLMIQNGAKVEFTGGSVKNNSSKNGAGMYVYKATLKMTGGSVSSNTATANGGGMYGVASTVTLSGGSISANKAKEGGGVCAGGTTVYLYGTSITGNTASNGGGGLKTGNSALTVNKVKTTYIPKVIMSGSLISGNTAKNGGGLLVAGAGATIQMTGGTITNNEATSNGGGAYISTNVSFTMTGGTIKNNTANSGGGVYHLRSTGIYEGVEIHGNKVITSGGALFFSGNTCVGEIKNVSIYDNQSERGCGGAVYMNNDVACSFTDCKIYKNTANTGGGVYAAPGARPVMTGCTLTENESEEKGGAICVRDSLTLADCVITNNKADCGGGIHAGDREYTIAVNGWGSKRGHEVGVEITNCTIADNTAVNLGGGIHHYFSTVVDVADTVFTGNTSGAQGSAIWSTENMTMQGITATDNKSTGNGYAIYLADADYDGHSYANALMKMGGDMVVKDNQGGDLYLGVLTTLVITGQGLGKNTDVQITLDSGLLTQRVFGAYNYEGGECVYTITYGDRSMTDPEELPAQENSEEMNKAAGAENTLLYVALGAFVALIVAAAVVVVLLKKKKAGKATGEASKN